MQIAFFSTQRHERSFFAAANAHAGHTLVHLDAQLSLATTSLVDAGSAVCIFVNDDASAPVLDALAARGVKLLLLRSAGFNHVDVAAADRLGMTVARVPAYSPHAVAEHAVALMLTLNRKTHRAFNRVREQNFSLGGLMGFDMHGKTVGVVGTGKIGEIVCRILQGFGCRVIASDPIANPACAAMGVTYVPLPQLLKDSDIISLHAPLTPVTRHMIDAAALASVKPHAMLINTSRGALIDTPALIAALKAGRIGSVGLDVYEEEGDLFFRDLSDQALQDDIFARLMTFPNVLVTAHQGFFTHEACTAIANTTITNATAFEHGGVPATNRVTLKHFA
ncbi:MAG TPA: 2-hydroxyacid dehydrogenase [Phycisphaerales bacterium]|nr:2-hydroxyacid dehydrogenase [Phycisphaerales bacterium]